MARRAAVHGFDTPVWTTERIAGLIWRRFRVRYSRDYVKHRLMPRLGWRWHKHTWLPATTSKNAENEVG
jgi:transposase